MSGLRMLLDSSLSSEQLFIRLNSEATLTNNLLQTTQFQTLITCHASSDTCR